MRRQSIAPIGILSVLMAAAILTNQGFAARTLSEAGALAPSPNPDIASKALASEQLQGNMPQTDSKGQQDPAIQGSITVGAVGPNGNHANPINCPGYYWRATWGQTLWTIAQDLGGYGGGCISIFSYLNQLLWLNPQFNWNANLRLIPGDPICFPQGRVWGQGRRLQQLGAVGPNGNHGYPSGCPQNQIGYAEAGDTPWSVASAFHCQYYNQGGGNVNYYLAQLTQYNPQIPSPYTPLNSGDQICVVN